MIYIYKITNIVNQKVYIGQTKHPSIRWSKHKCKAIRYKNDEHLCRAIRKYGINNFIFEIIDTANLINEADKLEIFYIAKYNSADREFGYNIHLGGQGTRVVSKETREKLSLAARGRIPSEETRRKISIANRGKIISDETKKKLSEFHSSKHLSDETKKKISDSLTGKKQSKKTIEKRSKSMRGKNKGAANGMFGKRSARAKLTFDQASEIRELYSKGYVSMAKLAEEYSVSKKTILRIIHKEIYISEDKK